MSATRPCQANRFLCILFVPLLLAMPARAAEAPPPADLATKLAALEKAFERERRKQHVPGAALVVVLDDRVILSRGFGDRDREQRLPVTPDTLFAIGSTTKAFTAATVMMSADDGKLSLTDSPKRYLPYFLLRDPEADAKITLSDLLSHRSGLDRTEFAWYTGVLRPRDVIRVAGRAKPVAKLGAKFLYQNVMYLVAGAIVAKVQDLSWQRVVERRIFRPLGMKSANTSVPRTLAAPDHALGYSYSGETKETTRLPMRNLTNIAPAGAINASVRDLAPWIRFMLGDGSFEGKRLISPERFRALTEKQMTIVGDMGYGYGWMLGQWRGRRMVEHGGNIDGFSAHIALLPEQRLGMAVLTNLNTTGLINTARNLVWEHMVGEPEGAATGDVASSTAPAGPLPEGDVVAPAAEVGVYRLADAGIEITIAMKEEALTLQVTGQVAVPLERVVGRRYKAGPPAPDGTFVTFRPVEGSLEKAELFLEQGGGPRIAFAKAPAKPEAAATAPSISVEELMAKVVAALGGEDALRRHRTLVFTADMEFENQGLTGKGRFYQRAPGGDASEVTLYGVGKKLATIREYFDGAAAATEISFSPTPIRKTGKSLVDARIAAAFAPELSWKTLFKKLTITKMEKVGDEDAFVVEKTPEGGNPVTDYISARTFLLLKRGYQASLPGTDLSLPFSETFSDYRPVDGVRVAFRRVQTAPGMGDVVVTLRDARFNTRVPDRVFRSATGRSQ